MSDNKSKTITEGSAQMSIPADQESTVFYNPVQVQNRDLSILMISLAAERRAVRRAVQAKRIELKSQNVSGKDLETQLNQYQASLDPSQVLADASDTDGLEILDALAASGLRSMRYYKEIPNVKHVTINDLDAAAVERAHANLRLNNMEDVVIKADSDDTARAAGIRVQQGDATHVLYNSRRPPNTKPAKEASTATATVSCNCTANQWDVIDLDPYGSAAPFLDAAVQAITNNGLLCVTCTDMAALGGSHPETCYGRYASMPIPRAGYLQEVALRILLQSIATAAAKYGRTIRPILSVGMDFYIRVFVEVVNDKAGVNQLSLQLGQVYQSTQCPSFVTVPAGQMGGKKGTVYQPGRLPQTTTCPETGGAFKVGGPLWLGALHNVEVVREALQRLEVTSKTSRPALEWIATKDRLRGLLLSCAEELPHAPLYYKLPELMQTVHVSSMPLIQFKAALVNAGYQVSGYHKEPQAIKTDAPNRIVWDVVRAWVQRNPPKTPARENSVAAKILAVEPSIQVDFTIPLSLKKREKGIARFPMNPQPHWGPKAKASGHKRKAEDTNNST